MLVVSRFRVITTLLICLLGLMFALPSLVNQSVYDKLPHFLQHTVSLGLELRGGSHIQLEVDLASVQKERQESIIDEARKQLRKQNIKYSKIYVQNTNGESCIYINLKDANDAGTVKKILYKIEKELNVSINDKYLF